MKVQFQGQSLRLRIGEDELARLLSGEEVSNATSAAPGVVSRQRVRLLPRDAADGTAGESGRARCDIGGGEWIFSLPETAIRDYVARLPCRDALEFELPTDGTALTLAFEVDVRDSVRRRGPPQRRTSPSA